MKKIIISLIMGLASMTLFAQVQLKKEGSLTDGSQNNQATEIGIYRLFPTQNIWTFIKLNTRTGQLWQVQHNTKDSSRFQSTLSLVTHVEKAEEKNGRFTLYPTQNIFTFILLDQIDGRVWQVQWSTKHEERFVYPIF